MDIDLDELVLLDEQDFEPPELYPEDEDELELHQHQQQQPPPDNSDQQQKKEQGLPKPSLAIPAKPITDPPTLPKTQFNGKKRFRSDDPNSRNSDAQDQSEDKRSRVHEQETENDEDWIRYSPPPPPAVAEPVVVEEKIISRYASEIDGNFIPVTGLDGDRVYAKTCSVVEDRVKKLDFKTQWTGLISEPIHILLQKAEKEAFTKALQASVGSQSDSVMQETPLVNEDLWVKKYAPRSFRELLSDERTNREVLFWLKQWDSCVFGSEMKATTDDVLSALKRHSSVAQHQKHSNRSFQGRSRESRFGQGSFPVPNNLDQEMNNDSNDSRDIWKKKVKDSGPPEQKILLLCGSPGLGKTTLAHVAARHCGYRVVEINASDDRSTSTIERKIHDVVQMNSVMADSMPKCLVIDEIDGALGDGKGAVEVILKMLSADRKSDAAKQDVAKEKETGKPSSKKKQRGASLLRPVICICNDLYAPALRPLRQVAKVHIFVQPTVSRVVNRLKFICTKEGLKASSTALTTLAQYTECDIRSCLNTLQFLHKKKEAVNTMDISSQVVGTKDTPKSFFDIWKEIFQKRKEKHERKLSNGCSNAFNEFQSILSLISNRGDYDTILDGVHENMLQLHYHDPVMRKTVKCLHSLGVSDLTHQYIMRSQKMSLQAYQPAIAITIRSLVAQNERPNIEWPKSFHRYRTGLMEKTDNLRSWHSKISPNVSRHLSTKSFVEDSISPLLHILSPRTLRPVAVYILSEKEKNDMAQLVDTMVSYSVTYKSLKSEPLTSTWRHEAVSDDQVLSFDPPIGDFIKFKGYTSDHFVLSAAVKQVLLHEVEKQNIIRGSMKNSMDPKYACEKANHTSSVEKNDTPQSSMLVSEPSCHNAKPTPNLKQSKPTSHVSSASGSTSLKLSSQKVEKKPSRGSFNYFERFKKLNSNGSQCVANQSKPATSERDSRPLLFKYNEGFTNAVKRPVRIRDFLV